MKKRKKLNDTHEPIGSIKVVKDFLPRPCDLVLKEETVKITITLTKKSLDFFKKEARAYHTQYQKMIRTLLDQYTHHFQ